MADDPARPVRVRIAPSPTGNCHVGTARNALVNLLFARQHGGQFILRIDDTDRRRSTRQSEAGVLEGLRWLGLDWDEGPDVGGPCGPYRQSERLALYRAAAQQLLEAGRAYYCFCTEEELARERQAALARKERPRYGGKCRALTPTQIAAKFAAGLKPTIRLKITPKVMAFDDLIQGRITQDAALLGDPVIVKADGMPVYSFATVIDEHHMQISHVIRGAEHINNTFPQLQMAEALGYDAPAFAHLGLLLNPDRSKISKRTGAVYIGEFRDQGYLPEAMINHLALSGWNPGTDQEIFSFDDLLTAFSLNRCTKANAIFDRQKLLWLNGYYIRGLTASDLARRVAPFLVKAGLIASEQLSPQEAAHLESVITLEQERLKTLADAPDALSFFFRDPDPATCLALLRANKFAVRHPPVELRSALRAARHALDGLANWTATALHDVLEGELARLGWKRAEYLMPIRIAVCGREATPSLFETLEHLDRAAVLRRLDAMIGCLST